MKYMVSMKVEGRIDVEVEADSPEEAFKKSYGVFRDADMSTMECIETEPVNCCDEDGNITDR